MSAALLIYIFIVQFFSFLVKGLVGFGNPLISSPLMSMKLDNSVITPGNLLLDLPVNAWMVLKNRHFFDAATTLPVALFCILGTIPGTLFLKAASPWIIKAILGVFIIGLGIEMATRRPMEKGMKSNRIMLPVISFLSGMMAGLFGINMLFLACMERVASDRQQFRSNVCFVFLIDNVFRTIIYTINGLFSIMSLQLTVISIPAAFFGVLVGGRIDRYISDATAKKAIIIVFLMGGASILVKALVFRT